MVCGGTGERPPKGPRASCIACCGPGSPRQPCGASGRQQAPPQNLHVTGRRRLVQPGPHQGGQTRVPQPLCAAPHQGAGGGRAADHMTFCGRQRPPLHWRQQALPADGRTSWACAAANASALSALQGVKVAFVAAGASACHTVIADVAGVTYTWGRNEVRQHTLRGLPPWQPWIAPGDWGQGSCCLGAISPSPPPPPAHPHPSPLCRKASWGWETR